MRDRGQRTREIEALYRQRYRHFVRVAMAIVGDEASGHDAVQDGFSRALREQAAFRGEGPLEAWVWRSVVNSALTLRRRRVARREAVEVTETEASNNGHAVDDSGVRARIAALPEQQRLAVYL